MCKLLSGCGLPLCCVCIQFVRCEFLRQVTSQEHHFPVEVDRRDQPILVAINIEHVKVADRVGRVERAALLVRYREGFWIVSLP